MDLEARLLVLDELYRIFEEFINSQTAACTRGCDSCCTCNVTLTTLGYGDITPVNAIAQSWTVLEAIIGQIYLAVLIARLVGMQAAHVSRKKLG